MGLAVRTASIRLLSYLYMDGRDQVSACVLHCCLSWWKENVRFGTGDYGTFLAEQKSYSWRYIKQDDEGTAAELPNGYS